VKTSVDTYYSSGIRLRVIILFPALKEDLDHNKFWRKPRHLNSRIAKWLTTQHIDCCQRGIK